MPIRFSLRFSLVAVTVIAIVIVVPVSRAIRQQRVIHHIYKNGGKVYFDNETPTENPFSSDAMLRDTSLLQNLRYDVHHIEFDFFEYNDQLRFAITDLRKLRTIRMTGHDSEFGAEKLRYDFPLLEVVDVTSEWYAEMNRYRR